MCTWWAEKALWRFRWDNGIEKSVHFRAGVTTIHVATFIRDSVPTVRFLCSKRGEWGHYSWVCRANRRLLTVNCKGPVRNSSCDSHASSSRPWLCSTRLVQYKTKKEPASANRVDSAHAASRVGPAPTSFYLGLHASAMKNKHPSLQGVAVVSAGVEELGLGDTRIYFPLEV